MGRTLLLSMIFCVWSIQAQETDQNCPTVEQFSQSFCQSEGTGNNFYRPAVRHLNASLDGGEVVWYASSTATTPLDSGTILTDGTTYYAGNGAGTCTSRPAVEVVIYRAPNAGRTTAVTLCSNAGPIDLLEVYNSSILGPPDAGGTFTPGLASGTTIFDPAVDAAGTYQYTVQSSNEVCPADDSIISISVIQAPNAGENATANLAIGSEVVDLFEILEGTPDVGGSWTPELASGSGIFDAAVDSFGVYTYTVSGGTNCEDATATVSVIRQEDPAAGACPLVNEAVQSFCASEGTGNNFYRPAVRHLSASLDGGEVVWYASSTATTPLDSGTILTDGTTYYAGNGGGTCTSRPAVEVVIYRAPNAGRTTAVTFCANAGPIDLLEVYNSSILGPPDAGGTFTPGLASGTTIFDPAVDAAGTYQYTVQSSNEVCPADDSIISISVIQAPNAGENATANLAIGSEVVDLFEILEGTPDVGGSWTPELASGSGIFDPAVDPFGVYTYTVSGGTNCENATATVSVIRQEDPAAGACPLVNEAVQSFCASEGTGNNFYRPAVRHLNASLDGGEVVWYASSTATTPLDSGTILTDGTTYYAGNGAGTCTSRPAVEVVIYRAPNAGRTTAVTFCPNAGPIDLLEVYNSSILGPPDAGGTFTPGLASGTTIFDPAVDAAGTYQYTVQSSNEVCPADYSIIRINLQSCESEVVQVNVFPNPGMGIYNLTGENVNISNIKVFSTNGVQVKEFRGDGIDGIQQVDISSLRSGLYVLELQTSKEKIIKRVIKN